MAMAVESQLIAKFESRCEAEMPCGEAIHQVKKACTHSRSRVRSVTVQISWSASIHSRIARQSRVAWKRAMSIVPPRL